MSQEPNIRVDGVINMMQRASSAEEKMCLTGGE